MTTPRAAGDGLKTRSFHDITEARESMDGGAKVMSERQVKSRARVAAHGEVFTARREVNAMLDPVKQETGRIDSRFLDKKTPTLIQFNDSPVAYLQAGKVGQAAG